MVLQHRSFFHDQFAVLIDIDATISLACRCNIVAIHCNIVQYQGCSVAYREHGIRRIPIAAQQRAAARDADIACHLNQLVHSDRSGDCERIRLAFRAAGQGRGAGDGLSICPGLIDRRQRHRRQQPDQHRQTKRQRQHAPAPFCRVILFHHLRNSFVLVSVLHT